MKRRGEPLGAPAMSPNGPGGGATLIRSSARATLALLALLVLPALWMGPSLAHAEGW
ncbi:MAG TPA: hypothetical protein VGI24_04785 [Solirubrobacteraceae bacterium]|jgi:hypothetical protein